MKPAYPSSRLRFAAPLAAVCIGIAAGRLPGQSPGPGVPAITYPASDLFRVIGSMGGAEAPNEHGTAALFLSSPAGANISGQAISVCAGVEDI